ncbi:MAG: MarR family transcriptional regulator [Candidatus Dactylopiibacterium sp.]|nr:MarR family transcriptional regulator [Candidatus Dactylopiibacterium sp.]
MSAPSASSTELARQLRELVGLYLVEQRRYAHDAGLSQQGRLLILLKKHGPCAQGEFGRLAGLDKSWISRIVERFVADGLVARTPLETDRRCLMLALTPAGLEEAGHYDVLLTRHAESFFERIPAPQRGTLAPALDTLLAALHDAAGRTEG